MKYCLLTWDFYENQHVKLFTENEIPFSGLFNWCKIFNGEMAFPRTTEEFSKYDIVHINITQKNLPLISKIVKIIDRNKTKILANVDYAIEIWTKAFPHPSLLFQELDKCDFVFSVEKIGAEVLSENLKREVPVIPHPVDVDSIKKLVCNERKKRIVALNHIYDNNYMISHLATNNIDKEWITAITGAEDNIVNVVHLFDEVQQRLSFDQMLKYLSESYCVIDPYTMHSYGRTTIELAALGVPCIGSYKIDSMHELFPDLVVLNNNPVSYNKILKYIINDKEFYARICRYARTMSDQYSFKNLKTKMLSLIGS